MSSQFKFNFAADDSTTDDSSEVVPSNAVNKHPVERRIGKEIFESKNVLEVVDHYHKEGKITQLKYRSEDKNEGCLYYIPAHTSPDQHSHGSDQPNILLNKINRTLTDLIPGEYEGGFKIWECSIDLIKYLSDTKLTFEPDVKVLELGCGAGLPGIYCLSQGASVHFQDYNEEVLCMTTIPNVFINSKFYPKINPHSCRYFSGDWSSFAALISEDQNNKYDYILSSETIYNPNNYDSLHSVIKSNLKTTGTAYPFSILYNLYKTLILIVIFNTSVIQIHSGKKLLLWDRRK
ncbi:Histidine protein methyltransferase 1, variant 2 [Chamberlinius hualienensis]